MPPVSISMNPLASNLADVAQGLLNLRLEIGGNGYTSHPIFTARLSFEMTFTVNFKYAVSMHGHFASPDMKGIVVASKTVASINRGVRAR